VEIACNAHISWGFEDIAELLATGGSYNISPTGPTRRLSRVS
jgi:hypothetical protein